MGARSHRTRGLTAAAPGLAALGLAAALGFAAPALAAGDLEALNLVRATGCDQLPPAQPLVANAALDAAAARLAGGATLDGALRASGVRAKEVAYFRVPRAASVRALAATLASNHCRGIANAALVEAGTASTARDVWFVVAVPFAPPPGSDAVAMRRDVLALVNAARAVARRCGTRAMPAVAPLSANATLDTAAQAYAKELAMRGRLSHEAEDGSTPGDRIARSGYSARLTAENLAAGPITAREAVDEWLTSAGHCANLMDGAFTEMGVAFALNAAAERGIYWVQLLATPR